MFNSILMTPVVIAITIVIVMTIEVIIIAIIILVVFVLREVQAVVEEGWRPAVKMTMTSANLIFKWTTICKRFISF